MQLLEQAGSGTASVDDATGSAITIKPATDSRDDLVDVGGRCGLCRADGPHRFVSHDHLLALATSRGCGEHRVELRDAGGAGVACRAVSALPHANDGHQAVPRGRRGLARDCLVVFIEEPAAFSVTDLHIVATEFAEHTRRNLSGVSAAIQPEAVLRAMPDAGASQDNLR